MIRILRLHRLGDLGALHDGWAGWMINARTGELVSPNGYTFEPKRFSNWQGICERARLWQRDYERRASGAVGALAPARPQAVTLQPEVWQAEVITEALPSPPIGADPLLTALLGLIAPALEGLALPPTSPPARAERAQPVSSGVRGLSLLKQVAQTTTKSHSSAVCEVSTRGHDGATMGPSSKRKSSHGRGDQ